MKTIALLLLCAFCACQQPTQSAAPFVEIEVVSVEYWNGSGTIIWATTPWPDSTWIEYDAVRYPNCTRTKRLDFEATFPDSAKDKYIVACLDKIIFKKTF